MPSDFDSMASQFCVPHLLDSFAERGTDRYYEAIEYVSAIDGEITKLSPVVLATPTVLAELDPDTGDLRRREQRVAHIPRHVVDAAGLKFPAVDAIVREASGSEWAIDLDATKWGPSVVEIGLARKILTRHHEPRRADL